MSAIAILTGHFGPLWVSNFRHVSELKFLLDSEWGTFVEIQLLDCSHQDVALAVSNHYWMRNFISSCYPYRFRKKNLKKILKSTFYKFLVGKSYRKPFYGTYMYLYWNIFSFEIPFKSLHKKKLISFFWSFFGFDPSLGKSLRDSTLFSGLRRLYTDEIIPFRTRFLSRNIFSFCWSIFSSSSNIKTSIWFCRK